MSQWDALYEALSRGKYSTLNPALTPAFIELTQAIGMIGYVGLREAAGCLRAIAGCFRLGGEIAAPIVGYEGAMAVAKGLYRRASYIITEQALESRLGLNLPYGAAGFKRNRGAHGAIEYCAFYLKRLPLARRLPVEALRFVLRRIGVLLIEKYQL